MQINRSGGLVFQCSAVVGGSRRFAGVGIPVLGLNDYKDKAGLCLKWCVESSCSSSTEWSFIVGILDR